MKSTLIALYKVCDSTSLKLFFSTYPYSYTLRAVTVILEKMKLNEAGLPRLAQESKVGGRSLHSYARKGVLHLV